MAGKKLFEAALAKVESKSIREWASKPGNKEAWIRFCAANPDADPNAMCVKIVCEAIGA
jgi:hypothetical protein